MTLADIRELCPDALTFGRARYIQSHGGVHSTHGGKGPLRAYVKDPPLDYKVSIQWNGRDKVVASWHCDCAGGRTRNRLCSHAAALLIDALECGAVDKMLAVRSGEELLGLFDTPPAREESLRLQAILEIGETPALALRTGTKRMYVIRDQVEFWQSYHARTTLHMGKSLVIDAQTQGFIRDDQPLADFAWELLREWLLHTGGIRLRSLPLTDARLLALLKLLENRPFVLSIDGDKTAVYGITAAVPPLGFSIHEGGGGLELHCALPKGIHMLDTSARYLCMPGIVYSLREDESRALLPFLKLPSRVFHFAPNSREQLLGEVLPQLKQVFTIDVDPNLEKNMVVYPLSPRVTLDWQGGEVTARVAFDYGGHIIDPFGPPSAPGDGTPLIVREPGRERVVLDILSRYGFRVRSGQSYLKGDDSIYAFFGGGLEALWECCEVFTSRALLAVRPRRARAAGRLYVRANRLEFSLSMEHVPPGDYGRVLEALLNKKEYVRLSDGAFLALNEQDGWRKLSDSLIEGDGYIENGTFNMGKERTAYISALLERTGLPIERDERVRQITRSLSEPEEREPPVSGMRGYQKRGFNWLCSIAELGMGGILADDMGLGKTLQVLSLIEWAKRKTVGDKRPVLVVAPTSLLYNWMNEVNKFLPGLNAAVMRGTAAERMETALEEYDLLITSYAQIRRDIDFLEKINFRFVILDEAQQIKNAASVGAEAARRLKADARFAMTGTPMENHIGELWSIFDFVLPGYLGDQQGFIRRYSGGGDAESLARRIRPFLMRRLKKDVLSELPEKIEHRVTAEMTPAQRDVYYACVLSAREELDEAALSRGSGRTNFQILAALTRLRQICCHPSLVFEGYEGGSGKLELLMELLRGAFAAGHRALVFSQFTGMLSLIAKELEGDGIEFFYLDGSTPSLNRAEMVDRFNTGSRCVFLISLRAGGAGLNLTGADTVIHYDPWWNPAVEEQATDRAHRIGQDKAVQVIRLVTRGTIEEKVFELKAKKQLDIDRTITPGEGATAGFTPGELIELFDSII